MGLAIFFLSFSYRVTVNCVNFAIKSLSLGREERGEKARCKHGSTPGTRSCREWLRILHILPKGEPGAKEATVTINNWGGGKRTLFTRMLPVVHLCVCVCVRIDGHYRGKRRFSPLHLHIDMPSSWVQQRGKGGEEKLRCCLWLPQTFIMQCAFVLVVRPPPLSLASQLWPRGHQEDED